MLTSQQRKVDGRLKMRRRMASVAALKAAPHTESHSSQALAELAIISRALPEGSALRRGQRVVQGMLMGLADLAGLVAAWAIGIFGAGHFHLLNVRIPIVNVAAFLAIFLAVFCASGLYPGAAVHPVDELRRLSVGTSLSAIVTLIVAVTVGHSEFLLRTVPIVWAVALAAVPLSRLLLRRLCAQRGWWSMPVLILGAGKAGRDIGNMLRRHPSFGLKPVGFLDDQPDRYHELREFDSLPYLGRICDAPLAARAYGAQHAIVAMPGLSADELAYIIRRHTPCFSHLFVVPDLLGTAALGVRARNFGGAMALEMEQHLARWFPQLLKRCVDVILAALSLLVLSPLFLFLYIAVRWETPGPVFFRQDRIGRQGNPFGVWKIRSMHCDGDEALHRACRENSAVAAEWQQYQKLREDPRVTQIGRRLRRLSLDELPQLWNVLRGDMSLVGPRPIIREEVPRYQDRFVSYALVRPGITGLWQVSGRNNTSYSERVAFDDYYVRNWSVWLDFYILARTLRTVLTCEGAY